MLNPILFTEKVVGDFLKYQITAYPFADPNLYAQMRRLLNLEETRATPLMKGPYISLSRTFRKGSTIKQLINNGALHPGMASIAAFPSVFGHQETSIREISKGKSAVISTGTGSGKTECFLYPIISKCLELRDAHKPEGIIAVVVYPMNALAEDQLGRMRTLLAGTGISFGMYVGKTPEKKADVSGKRLRAGSSKADYIAELKNAQDTSQNYAIVPPEERPSREEMRVTGKQPRILLTNVKQLELLLTRHRDVELFENVDLRYLVFDEAHTFKGAAGAETACLVRRLRTFCKRSANETICIATSATFVDPSGGPDAAKVFAERFFGVAQANVAVVGEEYEDDVWLDKRKIPPALGGDPNVHLKNILDAIDDTVNGGKMLKTAYQAMTGETLDAANWKESLYDRLTGNELVCQMVSLLKKPLLLKELVKELSVSVGRPVSEQEVLAWLVMGASSFKDGRPILRPVVHCFVRGMSGAVVTFPKEQKGLKVWLSSEDALSQEPDSFRLPVMTCTTCGQHYFVHHLADFQFTGNQPDGGEAIQGRRIWRPLDQINGGIRVQFLDRLISSEEDDQGNLDADSIQQLSRRTAQVFLCRGCGTVHPGQQSMCDACGRQGDLVPLYVVRQNKDNPGFLSRCVTCEAFGRARAGGYREPTRIVRATTVSDVHVLAQNMLHHSSVKRLLVFADNRQDAAFQAGWMQDHARRYRLRAIM